MEPFSKIYMIHYRFLPCIISISHFY